MKLNNNFILPDYGANCFSSMPGTIEYLLSGHTQKDILSPEITAQLPKEIDAVVFILFDAFGKIACERFIDDSPFLSSFQKNGLSVPTTSQFPSTTAAHVTTFFSGAPVYETGVCEWFYYEPKVEGVINPFKLNYYNQSRTETLLRQYQVSDILPNRIFFSELEDKNISVFRYSPRHIEPSSYGNYFAGGSSLYAYQKLSSAVAKIKENVASVKGKHLHYLYIPDYDSICHSYGPEASASDVIALSLLKELEELLPVLQDKKTAILMTADHGQVTLESDKNIPINQLCPNLTDYLKLNSSGEVIRFGGGYRNLLLYGKHGAVSELASMLQKSLNGIADVLTQEDASLAGIFGPSPLSEHFSQRIGDVIILPYEGYSVNWEESGVYLPELKKGHHGGLTAREMEIMFLALWG